MLAGGSAALCGRFAARFQAPTLHAQLMKRIVMGNTDVDHERVLRTFPEGTGQRERVMIYEEKHGRIATAWSIPGARTLDT